MEVGGGRPREGGSLTRDPGLGARTTAPSAKAQARGRPGRTVNSSGRELSQTSPDRTRKVSAEQTQRALRLPLA